MLFYLLFTINYIVIYLQNNKILKTINRRHYHILVEWSSETALLERPRETPLSFL